jgi:hypothetical protein
VIKVLIHVPVRQTPVARRAADACTKLLIRPEIAERAEPFPGHGHRRVPGARVARPDFLADLAAADPLVSGPFALIQGALR